MNQEAPSFGERVVLAFSAFFSILGDAELAARFLRARAGLPAPATSPVNAPEPATRPSLAAETRVAATDERAALQVLALLQREGRLLDFLEEDVAGFTDAQVGAAARVVHEGCRKAVREHLPLAPVREESEGAKVRVERGYDPQAIRLVGAVRGEPPYEGTLTHRGYRVAEVKLPKVHEAYDARVVAPAEVEL